MLAERSETAMRASKDKGNVLGGTLGYMAAIVSIAAFVFVLGFFGLPALFSISYSEFDLANTASSSSKTNKPPAFNKAAYDAKLLELAHVATSSPWYIAFITSTTTVTLPGATTSIIVAKKAWPVRAPYPADDRALLPHNRIVSYYGNFYSKFMGVLGEYPEDVMLEKLKGAVAAWEAADPATPVIPAIHYIAIVAQAGAGKDGKYRAVMPDDQIDYALELAKKVDGIVFIDLQVGLSNVETEIPKFEKYLSMPNVHLGLDPEFAMETSGIKPGRMIGTLDAKNINFAINYLSDLVKKNNLPPKVLMIHRFTSDMVTNYKQITPTPEVQFVMDMDGWGSPARKKNTYAHVVVAEPVQFTGFKLFYKNDLKEDPPRMMTPAEVLELTPAPSYIQYQ